MKHVYTRLLSDDELLAHLERGDSITFEGLALEWQQIERQVERLGFGDQYAVSRAKRPATGDASNGMPQFKPTLRFGGMFKSG